MPWKQAGIQAIETDLGEYIIQLAGTGPSHIIVPAVHLKKEEIAAMFSEKLHIDAPADPIELARIAREVLREKFLNAGMGISGGNFLIAETGTLVMVTNEGNGRMCTTMPDLHVAVVGIDKVIPDWESLTVFLKLLARSATGQKLSTYTQFITGPRHEEGEFGPKEFHLVLLDNGRSRYSQRIRSGGKSSNAFAAVPVQMFALSIKMSEALRMAGSSQGPSARSFLRKCSAHKPPVSFPMPPPFAARVRMSARSKFPIPTILRHLRRRVAQGDEFAEATLPVTIRTTAGLASFALAQNWLYRFGTRSCLVMSVFKQDNWIPNAPYPLSRWTKATSPASVQCRF